MIFKHGPELLLPELGVDNTSAGRFYVTPAGARYPSVTTVIGLGSDQRWKDEWIERVGAREAAAVSRRATHRGSLVHELAELYLRNEPDYARGFMPAEKSAFKHIRPILDEHVSEVLCLEAPLYSDALKTAGRMDLGALWDGEPAVVDFKTSKREKTLEQIEGYCMQESAYGLMLFERAGIAVKRLVTVITVDDSPPQVFVQRPKPWLEKFVALRKRVELERGV